MAARDELDFEKPLIEIEEKIAHLSGQVPSDPRAAEELKRLIKKAEAMRAEIFAKISPWQKTLIARHTNRPGTLDYIAGLFDSFLELHGDRNYADDRAIVGGIARHEGRGIVVIGHQKGKTVKERIHRNFGMPNPEGYRKALRLMRLAEKFSKPLVTFIDTPGAFPGVGAEERGQAEAIARNLFVMSRLAVPIVSIVIGEGGSGGALAIGVADRLLMLKYAVYSVISPEGCAAILWNNGAKAPEAAEMLKMTAEDLLGLGVIDEIIPEPAGGAHRDPARAIESVGKAVLRHLQDLSGIPKEEILRRRWERLRKIGVYSEG